ncbi:MAG: hypothetical protein DHS20C11_25070 [Lysobacteraceae bacterium]|nr:MAG: hypothetical protein DHS20C11_25070 [Xanthomonadaceae bacterium]
MPVELVTDSSTTLPIGMPTQSTSALQVLIPVITVQLTAPRLQLAEATALKVHKATITPYFDNRFVVRPVIIVPLILYAPHRA